MVEKAPDQFNEEQAGLDNQNQESGGKSEVIEAMVLNKHQPAEQNPGSSEALYRGIIENMQDVYYRSDLEGNLTLFSPSVKDMFGLDTLDDAIGFNVMKNGFLDPEQRTEIIDLLERDGKVNNLEVVTRKKDGSEIILLASCSYLYNEVGDAVGVEGVLSDITKRVQAQKKLEESEQKYRSVFNNLPVGIFQSTPEGRYILVNPAFVKMVGFASPEEMINEVHDIAELYVDPNDRREVKRLFRDKGKVSGHKIRFIRRDGEKRWMSIFASCVYDDEGSIRCYDGFALDVTEQVEMECALRDAEAYQRVLSDATFEAIFLSDMGMCTGQNLTAQKMFGYTDEEALGKPGTDWIAPEDREKVIRNILAGIEKPYEAIALRKDGTTFPAEIQGRMFQNDGKPVRVTALRDISERKRAEEELKKRTDELARLYRASGVLLVSATPDFENLAQSIVDAVLIEFEHNNCSLILVRPGSEFLERVAVAGPYASEVSQGELCLDGDGLVPQSIRKGEIINVPDVHQRPEYVPNWKSARSELVIPLKIDDRVLGVIDVQSSRRNAFTEDDERLMSMFAERAALALEHARLLGDAESRLERLSSLRSIDRAITSSFDLNISLQVLLDQLHRQLGIDASVVLLYRNELLALEFFKGQGFRTGALQHTHLRIGQGFAGRVALQRNTKFIPDLTLDEDNFAESPYFEMEGFVSYIGVPLISKGELVGVLEIFHRSRLDPDVEWFDFLETLAGQAALAIDNINLFNRLEHTNVELIQAYDATIEGWARALELRDMETEGHSRRVVDFTIHLARFMEFSADELADVRRGAMLHDIGKMGVPDSILQKTGPLNEQEWMIMKQHPVNAHKWLSPIKYLQRALEIPYYHHEKWDGTGYPHGLKGEQIPLAARIFAIVDVWDALNSDRPYRKAWTRKETLEYIRSQSGIHFDPRVVEAFFELLSDFEDL
jgi:PAS domain S-box-containing protein